MTFPFIIPPYSREGYSWEVGWFQREAEKEEDLIKLLESDHDGPADNQDIQVIVSDRVRWITLTNRKQAVKDMKTKRKI